MVKTDYEKIINELEKKAKEEGKSVKEILSYISDKVKKKNANIIQLNSKKFNEKIINLSDIIEIQDIKIQDEFKEIGLDATNEDIGKACIIMLKMVKVCEYYEIVSDSHYIAQEFIIFNKVATDTFGIRFNTDGTYSEFKSIIKNFINLIKDFCKNNIKIKYINIYKLGFIKVIRNDKKIDFEFYLLNI